MGARQPRQRRPHHGGPRQEEPHSENESSSWEHPGDPSPEEQCRSKQARPWDPKWVSQVLRKRGITAIHRNFNLGKDCDIESVFFFRNKIHGFWDGSVYPHDSNLASQAEEIILDILRRQVVENGELVRRTAKERKHAAKADSYRVQKPTTERNLRPRNSQARVRNKPPASPALTEIAVARSESAPRPVDASLWSLPSTPESTMVRPLRSRTTTTHDEPGADRGVCRHQLRHSPEARTPTSTNDHDAEGEPDYQVSDSAPFAQAEAHRPTRSDTDAQQTTSHTFGSIPPDHPLTGIDVDMNMDMNMDMDMDVHMNMGTDAMDMRDFGLFCFNHLDGLNAGLNIGTPSNAAGLQDAYGGHGLKEPMATDIPATPYRAASKTPHIDFVAAPASGSTPEPSYSISHQVNTDTSPQVPGSAQAQPGSSTEADDAPRQPQPATSPVDSTQTSQRYPSSDVVAAMLQALTNIIRERRRNAALRCQYDAGGAQADDAAWREWQARCVHSSVYAF